MALRFGVAKLATITPPPPIPSPRILAPSRESEAEISAHVRIAESESNVADSLVENVREESYTAPTNTDNVTGAAKLSRLLDDDFPFDPSQLAAIEGLASQQYGCMTGAAGTGKTTCTKAVVDRIKHQLGEVDMTNYFKKPKKGTLEYDELMDERAAAEDDDYEMPDSAIPSICMVGFTGRSTQMIKKNFPRDWHPNIMTIHRCLAYAPEPYDVWDPELDDFKQSMRFVPTYDENNLLPWDVIVIDEAGMVGVPLWENLYKAMKPGTRIIMIGDINQLPPVHGRSIFGFALSQWPSYELTHIHRQKTVDADGNPLEIKNSIVESAWAILQGYRPKSDIAGLSLGDSSNSVKSRTAMIESLQKLVSNKDWKFVMVQIPEDPDVASQRIRKSMELLAGKIYNPNDDSIITAINGHDGSRGMNLGQIPMNRELALKLNPNKNRFIIDAGRERRQFAVGDKLMATKNDYEAGITNGMTGICVNIEDNPQYVGDRRRFGLVADVNAYLADIGEEEEPEVSLDDIADSFAAQEEGREKAKEGKDRGPASHIVTVRFGEAEHAFEIVFDSLSEVGSLMTAYVVTCHKMQGGESPLCATIIHQSHKSMLYREWGYTADTRASGRQIFFYTDMGLRVMLNKQKIVGKTLKEKVRYFQMLSADSVAGKAVDIKLPAPYSRGTSVATVESAPTPPVDRGTKNHPAGFGELLAKAKARKAAEETVEFIADRIIIRGKAHIIHEDIDHGPAPAPKDGGTLTPQPRDYAAERQKELDSINLMMARPLSQPHVVGLIPERKLRSTYGAVETMLRLSLVSEQSKFLLTHQPAPVKVGRFGVKR